jgi:catechol 2,3-dioxygenase-like lactoylglutathione lyase family enzyme
MKAEPTLTTVCGIHHVTSIAADRKRTEEFYAGTLGLHLVRKTVNFDEPSVLHFYFGDTRGSPGSMITFFVHETEPPGRCGTGYVNRRTVIVKGALVPSEQKAIAFVFGELAAAALRFSTLFARSVSKVAHGLIVLSLASANDRRNALGVTAGRPKRLAHLKEDIWVA